jgi:hypothetical protein
MSNYAKDSKKFFEKFWEKNIAESFRHFIGQKIWEAGWNSAFRLMAPRFAAIHDTLNNIIRNKKLDITNEELKKLKDIANNVEGYEYPLIEQLKKFQNTINFIDEMDINDPNYKEKVKETIKYAKNKF